MPFPTNEAVERYSDGIDPYVDAYKRASEATTSVEAQEEMEMVRDQQLSKSAIVESFREGYGSAQ